MIRIRSLHCHGRRCWLVLAALLFLSSFVAHGVEPAPVRFAGIDLARMTYYPEFNITEQRVRRAMGAVIREHGGVIDMATVQDVSSRITALYRRAGFVFTRAYVPQQSSRNGWVELRLLEGWLSAVDILDNRFYARDVLAQPFNDLLGKVVYSPEMEESIALLNDYPGLNAFGFYSIGEEPGSTRLNVRVQREREWTGSLHTDNFGSDLTGRLRLLATAEKFNLTGVADRLRLSVLQTFDPQNASYGQLDYDSPLFDKRSRIALRVAADAFTVSRATSNNELIEFSGETRSARIEFTRHIKRGNAENRNWHVGASRDTSTLDLKDFDTVDLDQNTRELYAGVNWDRLSRRRNRAWNVGAEYVAGRYDSIDTPGQSRDYALARGAAAFTQGFALLGALHQVKVDVDWQYSGDILPAVSQYALTGAQHLRGFQPGDFSADTAAVGTLTWTLPKWVLRDRKGAASPDVMFSLFAEYGYGEQNAPTGYADADAEMADAGASWLFTLGPELSATLTLAQPLAYRVSYSDGDKNATRAWIELLWRFH